MDEKVRETVNQLNALITDMPYKIDIVHPKEIKLLDKNARYMSHEMFENLVSNIKKDGALTSLPLCYREGDGRLIVLSGNHRVQAAVHAGLKRILILLIDKELTRQEQVAIQLSHNAIEGKDDLVILKELWDEIGEIDLKLYAGLDSETIKELEKMEFTTISEATPDFKQMIMLFLPEEVTELKKVLADADMLFAGDENFVLSRRHYEEVFRLVLDVKDKFSIVSNPTAFMKVVEMAKMYMESLSSAV
jgi:hypothetical protein